MDNKIILFGATGYTGRLTAETLVGQGIKPVIAGRSLAKLEALAENLGGLEIRQANVEQPESIDDILNPGDILISTVGPFTKYGPATLGAAIRKQAHYLDSTGEPGFIRKVFQTYGPLAQANKIAAITAFGYDYVPGHCAAAAAIEKSGETIDRVDIGYFTTENSRFSMSQGTRSSVTSAMLEPGVFFAGNRLNEAHSDGKVRNFVINGSSCAAASVPGSEHLALPTSYPSLTEVNTYLGWFGWASHLMPFMAKSQSLLFKIPGYKSGLEKLINKLPASQGKGPSPLQREKCGSHIIALAYNKAGQQVSRAELTGTNPYTYTANILSWGAQYLLKNPPTHYGALGPVEAFGSDNLIQGCQQAGLELTVNTLNNPVVSEASISAQSA